MSYQHFSPHPKPITIIDQKYLNWLRTQKCCQCHGGFGDIVYAHQNLDIPEAGTGVAFKNLDTLALPIHQSEHILEHGGHYQIKGKAKLIYEHIMRYKVMLGDRAFIRKVAEFKVDNDWADRPYHDLVGFICRIWEDHR